MLTEITAIPGFSEPFCAFSHLLAAFVAILLAPQLLRPAQGGRVRLASVLAAEESSPCPASFSRSSSSPRSARG